MQCNKIYNSTFYGAIFAYLLINVLFVLKYGSRQNLVSEYLLSFGYCVFIVGFLWFFSHKTFFFDQLKAFRIYYVLLLFLVFIGFIAVDFYIDGETLNTDRWSALETVVTNVLQQQYPYNKLDHLQNASSNLPGLFYLALPFYFLGSIGLLQAFVFLFLGLFLLESRLQNHQKVLVLVLFLLSPAYLWEIIGKSDLMSNIILVLLFMLLWDRKYKENYFKNIPLLALFVAFFVLTRGVVVIPLTLFLFKPFLKIDVKSQVKFIVWTLVFILLISLPFFTTISSIDQVRRDNPFQHQTAFMPKMMQVFMLLSPFYYSSRANNIKDIIRYTFVIFFVFLSTTILLNVVEEGYTNAIVNGLSDISYLSMSLPFVIFFIAFYDKKNTMHA